MIFTDPPYNVAFNGRSGKFEVIENDNLTSEQFESFILSVVKIIKQINPKNYYIWCNWKFYGVLQKALDFKACIVWAKNVFGLGKGYRHQHEFCLFNGEIDEEIKNESDLWQIAKDTNYIHPTQKPVALCARALKNHKTAKTIVDLFGGSGSTLIACEQLKRACYCMELDPKYIDVIIQRWENFTGKKAELVKEA
jgi:site-specific DNA-methyltransferase (adenine-specific)